MVPLFKLEGRSSTGYYNALKSVIPVLSLLFGGSTFMLFGFMLMFMLVMCLAGAFASMFRGGFGIARNSIWAASSAVKSFVQPEQQKKRRRKQRDHQASLLSAILEEALAVLFDAMVSHQAS